MFLPFAHPREPVGVAVPLSLLAAGGLAGCANVRRRAHFPETLTVTSSFGRDARGGWDRQNVGANLTWRLEPLPVAPALPAHA